MVVQTGCFLSQSTYTYTSLILQSVDEQFALKTKMFGLIVILLVMLLAIQLQTLWFPCTSPANDHLLNPLNNKNLATLTLQH